MSACTCVCISMCKLKLEQSRKFSPGGVYIRHTRAKTVHDNSSFNYSIFKFEYVLLYGFM